MKSRQLIAVVITASAITDVATPAISIISIPDLTYDPIDTSVAVIRSVGQGLKLYDHVEGLTLCDYHNQNFFSTLVDAVSIFLAADGDTGIIREGIWQFTDSLGLFSYVVRSCYDSLDSAGELQRHYWDQLGSFTEAAKDIYSNVLASETELNELGWASFVGLYQGRYQDFAFGLSRAVYLAVLQTHFQTYVPSSANRQQSSVFQGQADTSNLDELRTLQQHKKVQQDKSSQAHPQVGGIYPFPRDIYNSFHYSMEMSYEFIRGSRVVSTHVLDSCESGVTNYMLDFAAAQDYIDLGVLLEDRDIRREGWFRIFDTFLLLTDTSRGCWDTYWRVGDALNNLISVTILSEEQALVNLLTEYYQISNNLTVFFADLFFSDWLSFAYYAGDTVYRLLVVQHELELNLS